MGGKLTKEEVAKGHALLIKAAAEAYIKAIDDALAAGLLVTSNSGTSYERIGGFVEVRRLYRNKTLPVLMLPRLKEKVLP